MAKLGSWSQKVIFLLSSVRIKIKMRYFRQVLKASVVPDHFEKILKASRLLGLFLAVSIWGGYTCTSRTGHQGSNVLISIDSADLVVQAAIDHAGGLSTWEAKKRLQFSKTYTLLLESGEVEKEAREIHDYQYHPYKISIHAQENELDFVTTFENGHYRRYRDSMEWNISEKTLEKAINSATYVIGVPFNLLDEGTDLAYEGLQKMPNDQMAEVVRVSYGAASADVWHYYFQPESRRLLAYSVVTEDHTSFVENLSYERVGGILFTKKRKSWRMDSLGNLQYLRAEYHYDNFQIE